MSQQVQQGSKPQLNLPGQSSVAEGPRDHSGMYIMHYAFRRDLANFTSAVQGTPLGDRDVWEAMAARWLRFVGVLHHHHSAEDTYYWPVLREAAAQRGTGADAQILVAMEDEHAGIDPSLAACTAAFDAVVDHPCEDHRNALAVRLAALREMLAEHLRHEETEALALVQRVVTACPPRCPGSSSPRRGRCTRCCTGSRPAGSRGASTSPSVTATPPHSERGMAQKPARWRCPSSQSV
ncbi:MAG: hemerythrin domain-containing protein [Micrococcales bacterium]|nr:hemerythrin domain-containing protein [Micrococcales bacterium]